MKKVFISAVTAELGQYRARLASELRKRDVEVVVQDDFRQGGGDLLDKLRQYMDQCDAVICLVGRAYGTQVTGGSEAEPDQRSFTQWEFDYALQRNRQSGMPLLVYVREDDDSADGFSQSEEHAASQAQFVERVLASGIDYEPIENEDRLAIRVLHHDWGGGPRIAWRWMAGSALAILLVAAVLVWLAIRHDWTVTDQVTSTMSRRIHAKVDDWLSRPPVAIDTPNPERQVVDELPPPNRDGFIVLRKDLIWDLRQTRRVSENVIGPKGSALTLQSTHTVQKTADRSKYVAAPKTTGTELFCRPDGRHPFQIFAIQRRSLVGEDLMLERQIHSDVSKIPIGGEFVISVRSTFWNSMQSEQDQWVGVQAREGLKEASILIIFPEDRPCKTYWATAASHEQEVRIEPEDYDSDNYFFLGDTEHGRWVYWEVLQPKPGYVYQVRWTW